MSFLVKVFPLLVIFSSLVFSSSNDPRKKAFNLGINTVIKVVSHEKSQAFKPIENGYCLEVDPVGDGDEYSFSAIKLESIALYVGLSPSLMEYTNFNGKREKKLCFNIFPGTEEEARNSIDNIRYKFPDVYKKIERFYPHITRISNSGIYRRVVPIVGELYKDKESTVRNLASAMEKVEKESKNIIASYTTEYKKSSKYISEIKKTIKTTKATNLKENKEKLIEILTQMQNIQKDIKRKSKATYSRIIKIEKAVNLNNIKLQHVVIRYIDKKAGIKIKEIDSRVPRILIIEPIKGKIDKNESSLKTIDNKENDVKVKKKEENNSKKENTKKNSAKKKKSKSKKNKTSSTKTKNKDKK